MCIFFNHLQLLHYLRHDWSLESTCNKKKLKKKFYSSGKKKKDFNHRNGCFNRPYSNPHSVPSFVRRKLVERRSLLSLYTPFAGRKEWSLRPFASYFFFRPSLSLSKVHAIRAVSFSFTKYNGVSVFTELCTYFLAIQRRAVISSLLYKSET